MIIDTYLAVQCMTRCKQINYFSDLKISLSHLIISMPKHTYIIMMTDRLSNTELKRVS